MVKDYKTKSCCIYDYGLFTDLAVRLAKDFGLVYYCCPNKTAFPSLNQIYIGTGIENVERVYEIAECIDDVDVFVFPDVYSASVQSYLDAKEYPVWGSRDGESMEVMRAWFMDLLAKVGLPVPKYEVVRGFSTLLDYLSSIDRKVWVKVSLIRGDIETFCVDDLDIRESFLDDLRVKLGPIKEAVSFVVEDDIEAVAEVGYDGYTIDGQFPGKCIEGVETKSKGYVGKVVSYKSLDRAVRYVNDKLSDTLRSFNYRNFFSTEIRVTKDGTPYLIDPCCRAGSPPSEIYFEAIKNLAEIIWEGAHGRLVEPEFEANYFAELILSSPWAEKNILAIDFPKDIERFVKLRNCCLVDGKWYILPQPYFGTQIGGVIGWGDSFSDAIDMCIDNAKAIRGIGIEYDISSLYSAWEDLSTIMHDTGRAE